MFINWQKMAVMLFWSQNTGCGHLKRGTRHVARISYRAALRGLRAGSDALSSDTTQWTQVSIEVSSIGFDLCGKRGVDLTQPMGLCPRGLCTPSGHHCKL